MSVELILGDCLDVMPTLEAQSFDAIITDLPYGTTACAWDTVIPFEPMWANVKRLLKPRGVFVTTASQPFTSALVMSNIEWFKYCWIWEKDQVSNPQLAKFMPLKNYEDIAVFSQNGHIYNPQGMIRTTQIRKRDSSGKNLGHLSKSKDYIQEYTNYPKMIFRIETERGLHPTQKPVALYEYLILTYTNPGARILDIAAGSGTTGVAAHLTGRDAVLIEKEANYYTIAERRIRQAQAQPSLFQEG